MRQVIPSAYEVSPNADITRYLLKVPNWFSEMMGEYGLGLVWRQSGRGCSRTWRRGMKEDLKRLLLLHVGLC